MPTVTSNGPTHFFTCRTFSSLKPIIPKCQLIRFIASLGNSSFYKPLKSFDMPVKLVLLLNVFSGQYNLY